MLFFHGKSTDVLLGARVQPTVDRTVEEQETFHDCHVVVEMRGVSMELFVVVRSEKAPGPATVIVQRDTFAGVLAKIVRTSVTVFLETMLFLEKHARIITIIVVVRILYIYICMCLVRIFTH